MTDDLLALVAESRAAQRDGGDHFDVHHHLTGLGHGWQTIESVLAYLAQPEPAAAERAGAMGETT